jgi:hypothetical protein
VTAGQRLTMALLILAASGGRPPRDEYGSHELWCSDDADERRLAVARCQACPVIRRCGDTADEHVEQWHVWGGRDRTKVTKTKGAAA